MKSSSSITVTQIKEIAKKLLPELIRIRRTIHQNPELSFQEYNTAKFITNCLKKWDIDTEPMANNGVYAKITGKNPSSRIFALRADIDALPITETNDCEYRSMNEGVMHACGHDLHTASLLGTAFILQNLKNDWEGTAILIFQPGEEKLPGGASIIINEGWLENPKPDYIIAQHAEPDMEVGKIGIKKGQFMASADEVFISIEGLGGHGARPHECIDTILIASQLVVSLQQIVSRKANPLTPSVLTFGKINSEGGATNVIPSKVRLEGTFRTFDEKWRNEAHILIKDMSEQLCKSLGGSCVVDIVKGYPFLYNNELLSKEIKSLASEYLGDENVIDLKARMGAEDFSFYSQIMPANLYRLGSKNPNGSGLHSPNFDIDEKSLEIGAGLMAWISINNLDINNSDPL